MKKFLFGFVILLCSYCLNAQTFKGYITTGLNAGQIEGDFEVGYNKVGLQGGVGVGVNLNKQWFASTEFLYSRRGSKNALFVSTDEANGQITLDYIDLPLIVRLGDWYQEDDKYNKVWVEGGLSVGRLINASVEGSNMPEIINEFNSTDFSFIGGLGYNINKNFFMNFRYTRSILPFYRNLDAAPLEASYLTSYFLSLRLGYSL